MKKTRILSIDGGGILGIIPSKILERLEQHLKEKDPEFKRLIDYFDFFTGTSIGGVIVTGLLTPKEILSEQPTKASNDNLYTPADITKLLVENGPDIFSRSWWYTVKSKFQLGNAKFDEKSLEAILEKFFKNGIFSDLIKPCVVTAYDIKNRQPHFFRSRNQEETFLIREALRATSAAPTYFTPTRLSSSKGINYDCIDGGVIANNPSLVAYSEARKLPNKPTAKDMVLISLGTGRHAESIDYKKARSWGSIGWLPNLFSIFMDGSQTLVDYQLKKIFEATSNAENYLRIEKELEENIPMDDASTETIKKLEELGTKLSIIVDPLLDKTATQLIKYGK